MTNVCIAYCRDVTPGNSDFYSYPVARLGEIFSNTDVDLHVLTVGDFDPSLLETRGIVVHNFERRAPRLGLVSLYLQLFVTALYLGYDENIDLYSNVWAPYNLAPVMLASDLLSSRTIVRTFGLGNLWDRSTADKPIRISDPRGAVSILQKRLLNRLEGALFDHADAIYTDNKIIRDRLTAAGVNQRKFTVISQGVDVDFFSPPEPDNGRKQQVLFAGRLDSANKRFKDAVDVFHRVAQTVPEANFVVAGEGALTPAVRSRLAELDSFEHRGYLDREELREEYRQSSVLLLTSVKEGVPNVVLEAQACGLPVVATPAGSIPQLHAEGAGIVVAQRDTEMIAGHVRQLLTDETRWMELSKRGNQYVRENHAFDAIHQQYVELFSDC